MSSTSILEPAACHVPVRWHHSPAHRAHVIGRPVHQGPRGRAQRRALLEARWRDKLERITALSVAYHDAAQTGTSAQPGSHGAPSRRARHLARQVVAERQALAEIEAALDRIAAGRYGWCEECGQPIATARLAAQPQARYCAACGRQPGQRIAYA